MSLSYDFSTNQVRLVSVSGVFNARLRRQGMDR